VADLAVVIPSLDEERVLARCLDAVGGGEGLEVVVADGGSRDASREIAARSGARVVAAPRGRGPQLNAGASATAAPRLLFVHADCELPLGWRPALRRALDDPRTALACFRLHTVPSGEAGRPGPRGPWLRGLDLRSRLPLLPYGDQGFGVRRELFEALGGFPEIPLMEDLVFARACRRRGRIRRLPLAVRTTARRFEGAPLAARLKTLSFPWLFRLGVSPHTLARWYGTAR
jgi:glycosyltransferase involved in cell wall biosynthesis